MRTNELVDSMVEELGKEANYMDFVYETSWIYGAMVGVLVSLQVVLKLVTSLSAGSTVSGGSVGGFDMKSRND